MKLRCLLLLFTTKTGPLSKNKRSSTYVSLSFKNQTVPCVTAKKTRWCHHPKHKMCNESHLEADVLITVAMIFPIGVSKWRFSS